MFAEYGNEESNLKVSHELPRFLFGNLRNLGKRIVYNYFLRNFNYASLQLIFGLARLGFGFVFGAHTWIEKWHQGTVASSGTVMLAALPIIIGLQLLLGFVNYDMTNVPSLPLQRRLHRDARMYVATSKADGA
jgi:dolichol-phosphate mannosyltransferase